MHYLTIKLSTNSCVAFLSSADNVVGMSDVSIVVDFVDVVFAQVFAPVFAPVFAQVFAQVFAVLFSIHPVVFCHCVTMFFVVFVTSMSICCCVLLCSLSLISIDCSIPNRCFNTDSGVVSL